MSRFYTLRLIECAVTSRCPDYVSGTLGVLLIVVDFFPQWVPLLAFVNSLSQSEIVLTLFSVAWFSSDYINRGLQAAFDQPPPTVGCGEAAEMPSFATQHVTMIGIMLTLMALRWYLYVSEWRLVLMHGFVAAVTYARIYIGYSTPLQLYVGAWFGLGVGLAWFALIGVLLYPWMDRIIRWPVVRWFYLHNDICQPRSLYTPPPQPPERTLHYEPLPVARVAAPPPPRGAAVVHFQGAVRDDRRH